MKIDKEVPGYHLTLSLETADTGRSLTDITKMYIFGLH